MNKSHFTTKKNRINPVESIIDIFLLVVKEDKQSKLSDEKKPMKMVIL